MNTANISFVSKFLFTLKQSRNEFSYLMVGYISACCTIINVRLSGEAFKYRGSMSGIYHMQSGFLNESSWLSPEGNAIWYTKFGWMFGPSKDLGATYSSLYLPIKDPSKECPHDDLQSNWWYAKGNEWIEDIDNSVLVQCVQPS